MKALPTFSLTSIISDVGTIRGEAAGETTHTVNIYTLNSSTDAQQESSALRVYTVDPAVISMYHRKTEKIQNK